MKYIIYSACIAAQALYWKNIYIKFPLKSFTVYLCIIISERNYGFPSEILLVYLDDLGIVAHLDDLGIVAHMKSGDFR